MIVTHQLTCTARCPIDDSVDVYDVTIDTDRQISVESILEQTAKYRDWTIYQEDLTKHLGQQLEGCTVTTHGAHSGVRTTVTVGP
jgi:NADPH-dependent 7-cyano-7-deazaguanine reductase QueF